MVAPVPFHICLLDTVLTGAAAPVLEAALSPYDTLAEAASACPFHVSRASVQTHISRWRLPARLRVPTKPHPARGEHAGPRQRARHRVRTPGDQNVLVQGSWSQDSWTSLLPRGSRRAKVSGRQFCPLRLSLLPAHPHSTPPFPISEKSVYDMLGS